MSYPSKAEINQIFSHLGSGNSAAFFENVADDVDWTVMGTHPLAGNYTSLAEFQKATFSRLGDIMKPPGMQLAVRNIVGGGDEWAVVELVINAVANNGFVFDNCYAWVCRFDKTSKKIVQVRAYLDSWMVREVLVENEKKDLKNNRAIVPRIRDL